MADTKPTAEKVCPIFSKDLDIPKISLQESNTTQPAADGELAYVDGTGFRFKQEGTVYTMQTAAGGSIGSWDSLYDLDKSLTVDSTTMTFAGTHATGDAITITKESGDAGACLQLTHGDTTKKDIDGTGSAWSVTGAGAIDCTGITVGDDETVTFGDSSDATIQWANSSSFLDIAGATNFDGNVSIESAHNLTMAAGTLTLTDTTFTYTEGDMAMSDGSLAITDADNAATFSVTNATLTTGAHMVNLTADAITDKSILYIDNGGDSLTSGFYINCNDDGTSDFTVGADGATAITTAANSTLGLTVTGIQTSENMVLLDNTSGVVASDKGVLKLDAGGNIADGSNIFRIDATGTPVEGSKAIEVVGSGKVLQGFYIDTDTATNSANQITAGGAIADNKAALEITSDGTPAASGSNVLRVNFTGTHTNKPTVVEVNGAGKDCQGLAIDADPTAGDVANIHSDAVIAADKSVLNVNSAGAVASGGNVVRVDVTGTPASGAVYTEFDFAGLTDTHENVGVLIDAGGKKVQALSIDADPIAGDVVYVHSDAVIADNKGIVNINGAGAMANGSAALRVSLTGTPAATSYGMEIDLTGVTATNNPGGILIDGAGDDVRGISVDVDNTDVDAVIIDGSGAITGASMLMVDNDGTPAANTDMVAEITFTGTATNNPIVLSVNNSTKDATPLMVNSNVAAATRPAVTITQDSLTGANTCLELDQDDVDHAFIEFDGDEASGSSVNTDDKSGGDAKYIMVTVNGSTYYLTATPGV